MFDRKGCRKFESLLEDYLTGNLPKFAAEEVTHHLEHCEDCSQVLEEARLSSRLIAPLFEAAEEPGPAFTRRVMSKIDSAEQWIEVQKNFWRPLEALAWRLAFTASLALVFLFVYGMRMNASHNLAVVPSDTSLQTSDVIVVPAAVSPSTGDDVLLAIADKHYDER